MKSLNENKILKELFNKPTYGFHIRELARETKLNPNTIITLTNHLEEEGLIKKEKKKHLVEVSLNFENPKTIQRKKLFNLSELHDSGLIEFLIEKYNYPKAIILFGSFARGEDAERSDIDIAIITPNKHIPELNKYEKILGHEIQLFEFSEKEIQNMKKNDKELLNNLLNGFVLSGYFGVL